ncbi:MAG: hypothetical protein RMK52_07020 [Chitinophagales bacterium]|nr:hypothetical protein [Chitinophagales bacterium]MDW8393981.1 hypothetical protein [Chitinophagales bacterium]
MIRLFQTYHPSVFGLLLLYGVGLRLSFWLSGLPMADPQQAAPLARAVFALLDMLPGSTALWQGGVATGVALVHAFYLNYLVNHIRLMARPGYLPAAAMLLVASLGAPVCMLSAPLMGSMFLLFAFGQMVSLYRRQEQTAVTVLYAALLVGVAGLFYLPYFFFSVFLVVALAFWIPFQARAYLLVLIGLALPLYFLTVYYFWVGRLDALINELVHDAWPQVRVSGEQPLTDMLLPGAALAAVMLWSFFYLQANLFRMVVQVRLFLLTMMLFFGCGLLLTLVHPAMLPLGLAWLLVPAALALALFLSEFRWRWLAEAYQLFLLFWTVVFPYFS